MVIENIDNEIGRDHRSFSLTSEASRPESDAANGPSELGGYVHLRALRASGHKPPLICFFPGPPGARDLAASLPNDQPVYEIFWPNMDNSTRFPTVEELAALFAPEIRKLLPKGPYQFCGYSTFGLVAYEMGRLFLSQGEDVPFLALFDIWHPQFRQMLTPKERVRYKALRLFDRLSKYGRILYQDGVTPALVEAGNFAKNKVKSIVWQATRFAFRMADRAVPKSVQIIESIAANQTYVPLPYPRRFVLIRPNDFLDRNLTDATVGWHACAEDGINIFFVEGDHGRIKDLPFVREIAERISPHLASGTRP
jgi:thioesterase domain-containing protein